MTTDRTEVVQSNAVGVDELTETLTDEVEVTMPGGTKRVNPVMKFYRWDRCLLTACSTYWTCMPVR